MVRERGDQDFEQDFDSSVNGEEEGRLEPFTPPNRHSHTQQDQDKVRSRNSPDKGPGEEVPGVRDGEERRRPETLQIWQEREKQNRHRTSERRERGISISSGSRPASLGLPAQGEMGSKLGSGGCTGNSAGAASPPQGDGRVNTDPGGPEVPAARADRAPHPVCDPPASGDPGPLHKPNSFLFRSSTRGNLKSSSAVSPVSPLSPTQMFADSPLDTKLGARLRSPEQEAREEEQVAQLRKSIESRLNCTLPGDLGEALNNGVTLCQLVNHIRPRSISIIHIPSPAVPQLSLAKSRRNVESFLEACRKMGVPQDALCRSQHILEEDGLLRVAETVQRLEQAARPKPVRLAEGD